VSEVHIMMSAVEPDKAFLKKLERYCWLNRKVMRGSNYGERPYSKRRIREYLRYSDWVRDFEHSLYTDMEKYDSILLYLDRHCPSTAERPHWGHAFGRFGFITKNRIRRIERYLGSETLGEERKAWLVKNLGKMFFVTGW
jgi:hypothetical protein